MKSPQEMTDALDAVVRRNPAHVDIPRTPLEELLRAEETADIEEQEIRDEERIQAFRVLLEFFFQDGPHPYKVLRLVMAVTKAVKPELIGDMSLDDIAIICGDGGKATVSARIKRTVNGTMEAAGMRATRVPFQKTGAYSQAQMGNSNRKKSRKKR